MAGVPDAGEALQWAARNIVCPQDELHLVTVVKPRGPSPNEMYLDSVSALPILYTADSDPEYDMAAVSEASPWVEPAKEDSRAAQQLVDRYAQQARQIGLQHVKSCPVAASASGQQGIGQSICKYTLDNGCDSLVVGNRGLGALSRSLLGVVGLGSVSDYCVKHVPVPVTVYNSPKMGRISPRCAPGDLPPSIGIPDYCVSA
ncbi:hypothetical protein WJX72_003354 [[Myrmecia] bisecta]|uniref:UspA domain-containing protein n=1 Tax=[Myrmecia] bisecta TaxID=41462 RepID=A0AAW1Q6U5_9CHLO